MKRVASVRLIAAPPHPRAEIAVAGVGLVADIAGALYWPEQGLVVVALSKMLGLPLREA